MKLKTLNRLIVLVVALILGSGTGILYLAYESEPLRGSKADNPSSQPIPNQGKSLSQRVKRLKNATFSPEDHRLIDEVKQSLGTDNLNAISLQSALNSTDFRLLALFSGNFSDEALRFYSRDSV